MKTMSLQGVTLGAFTVMYLILVVLMTRCFLNEVYLIIFSYSELTESLPFEINELVFVPLQSY